MAATSELDQHPDRTSGASGACVHWARCSGARLLILPWSGRATGAARARYVRFSCIVAFQTLILFLASARNCGHDRREIYPTTTGQIIILNRLVCFIRCGLYVEMISAVELKLRPY